MTVRWPGGQKLHPIPHAFLGHPADQPRKAAELLAHDVALLGGNDDPGVTPPLRRPFLVEETIIGDVTLCV
jgi:hypothetical protein